MKIVVLTDSTGKVVGASLANGDEGVLTNIRCACGTGLVDLRCQIIKLDTLMDLGKFVSAEVEEAEADRWVRP